MAEGEERRRAGERLGRYELARRLGSGASGEVWEATLHGPEGFRRTVALKVLRGAVDEDRRASMWREARIGARLQHPNVVAVLDVGEAHGRVFVAMERVDGASLLEAVRPGPLAPRALLEAAVQTCVGLAHLHAHGLVHRDVKPSNLLLDRFGTVKIADLGIARGPEEGGRAVGTPGYASPEQLAGRPTDPRSDLFSLGVTLAALATGEPPLGVGREAIAATADVDARVAAGLLDPVDAWVPGLRRVLQRCLRAEPDERWPDARALRAALEDLLGARETGEPGLLALLAAVRPDVVAPAPRAAPAPARAAPDAATVAFVPGNLPPARDRFVGRGEDVGALAARLRTDRLVSLLGPGGTGKTRLALAVAREVATEREGGAWFFDLSEARDVEGACAAVARALSIELDRRDPAHHVGRVLASRGRALFVLDNLEQLVDALPDTLSRWLDLAPEAAFLATSRAALHLRGERRFGVEPLPLDAAVELFLERAPRPPAASERPEVEALVEALDRLPLAIELAAARTRLLSLSRLRERLTRRLPLLVDGDRDRPERQRSLSAALEGSWELLSPPARRALAQLTVFEGGATLAAAEAVLQLGPGAPWVLEVLDELSDASLLRVDPGGDRFRMLSTLQEWAAGHLTGPERTEAEARHWAAFAAWGRPEALRLLEGPGSSARLAELCADLDNLSAACRRAAAAGDASAAAAAFVAASEALLARGPLGRAFDLGARVRALPLDEATRAAVSLQLGLSHLVAGRIDEGSPLLEEAARAAVAAGDRPREWFARGKLVWCGALAGRHAAAEREIEALVAEVAGGPPRAVAQAWREAGAVAWAAGRLDEAMERMRRAREGFRAVGDARGEGSALCNLGLVANWLGRYDEGLAWLTAAEPVLRACDDRRNLALVRLNLGLCEVGRSRPDRALAHLEEADRALTDIGDERSRASALAHKGQCHRELGRGDAAARALAEAREAQQRLGDRRAEVLTCWHLASLHQERGRFAEALALLDEATALAEASGLGRALPQVRAKRAYVSFDAGERDAALADVARAVADARRTADWAAVAQTLGSQGALLLRAGRPAEALPLLREAAEGVPGGSDARLPLRALFGEARARCGDPGGLEDVDVAVAAFRAGGHVPSLAEALLQRAFALAAVGRGDEACAALAEAATRIGAMGLPDGAPLPTLRAEAEAFVRGPRAA